MSGVKCDDIYFGPRTEAEREEHLAYSRANEKSLIAFTIKATPLRIKPCCGRPVANLELHGMSVSGKHQRNIRVGENMAFPIAGIMLQK